MATWDEAKRRENLRKHQVDLALAEHFDHVTALTEEDTSETYGEQRHRAIGWIGDKLYVYAYALRGDEERAISLRYATPKERRRYAEEV